MAPLITPLLHYTLAYSNICMCLYVYTIGVQATQLECRRITVHVRFGVFNGCHRHADVLPASLQQRHQHALRKFKYQVVR